MTDSKTVNIVMRPMRFVHYTQPMGFLDMTDECFALWYYYVLARKAYEEIVLDPMVYEGDKDPTTNFQQLMTSVAKLYGVQPEGMTKCWKQVDAQCWAMQLPKMPEGEKYRFDSPIIIQ